MTSSAPIDLYATLLGTGSLVLKILVYNLLLTLQKVVTFTDPPTFGEALALAQHKEDNLLCMVQPPINLLHSIGPSTTTPPIHPQHKIVAPTTRAMVQQTSAKVCCLTKRPWKSF